MSAPEVRIITITEAELERIVMRAVRNALEMAGPRQAPQPPTGYLTVAAAAERAGCSQETIREWIHAGKLPRRRVGAGRGHYRIAVADLERAMVPPEVGVVDETELADQILARRKKAS